MASINRSGPVVVPLNRHDGALRLHDVPFELVPCEVPFFLVHTPAGFGTWTAVTASQGFKREWRMRSEMRSPAWTTDIAQVPTVRA